MIQKINDFENKPLELTFQNNIHNFMDKIGIAKEDQNLFYDGAQYGYNLSNVFSDELKKLVKEFEANAEFIAKNPLTVLMNLLPKLSKDQVAELASKIHA